jgi:hypothetical protein
MATKIYSPVAGFTGVVGGVDFKDGEGQVEDADDPRLANYFRPAGYVVGAKDDRAGATPAYGAKLVVKGAGDGPMIEQLAEAQAEAEKPVTAAAKKAAAK